MSVFHTSREFPAPPDAVFAAISDRECLARWWGPAGFTNTFEAFEFAPGGRWKFMMHGPDGTDYPNEARFEEIVPGAKVVVRHVNAPHFQLTIALSPSASGTSLTWTQSFDDPRVAEAVRHIVEPSNEQNLDRLAAELAGAA